MSTATTTPLTAIAILTTLVASHVAGAQDPRFPPALVRSTALGCWDVGAGVTLDLHPMGRHSLGYTARFTERPHGGPGQMTGFATWVAAAGEFEVACRPRSQHGGFCRVSPVASGLRVKVFAFHAGGSGRVTLADDFVAHRCTTP